MTEIELKHETFKFINGTNKDRIKTFLFYVFISLFVSGFDLVQHFVIMLNYLNYAQSPPTHAKFQALILRPTTVS